MKTAFEFLCRQAEHGIFPTVVPMPKDLADKGFSLKETKRCPEADSYCAVPNQQCDKLQLQTIHDEPSQITCMRLLDPAQRYHSLGKALITLVKNVSPFSLSPLSNASLTTTSFLEGITATNWPS